MKSTLPPLATVVRWRALVTTAALAAVALLALVLLQLQQLEHLKRSLHGGDEERTVYMHRQLVEYLHVREQWALALDAGTPLDLQALALRYDIWVGRTALLREDSVVRQMAQVVYPALDTMLARVEAFVRAADPVLADPVPEPARRQALARLQPQLVALEPLMQELSLAASHRATQERAERDGTLGRYTRVALAVTALLTLMTLAFAALALRQMQLLRQRQSALETLAGELASAQRAAEASSQAKSHFLANMSHEIRTPFQGLLGMLGMLRNTPLDARQVDYLRTASDSADHLLMVLSDILDLSQLEAGQLRLHTAPTALRPLLQEVETLMRPQASQRNLALHVDIDPAAPARVLLDATRLKQVLFNLLSNAIKFSARGSVELSLRVQPGSDGAPQLVFAVSDSGPGMDAATLARVFERFERADTAAAGAEGSGLGLAIARNLARLMGGEIEASSTLGKGSRFCVVLPLLALADDDALAPARAAEAPPVQALRLLVAEDHPVNRQVLAALLESLGHQAHFVADGAQAVTAAQAQAYDLVLMDLHMPGVDGIEATRRIRALPDRRAATLPIVALTADAFTDTRERCLVAGMNSFLTKPVSRDKLGALLRQLFGPARSEAPADGGTTPAALVAGAAEATRSAPLIDSEAVARTQQALSAERYAQVLGLYLDQAVATAAQMRSALREAQPLALRTLAHATCGAALNFGLPALAATAKALQDGAAHLPAHEVARLVQRFEELIAATREAATAAALLPGGTAVHG